MHPIIQTRFLPLLATATVLVAGCNRGQPKVAPSEPPKVTVGLPTVETVTDYEAVTGRTEVEEGVEVRAHVSGYLEDLTYNKSGPEGVIGFKDGDDVVKGQLLFQIDDSLYKATLKRDEANVKQAKARLDRTVAD